MQPCYIPWAIGCPVILDRTLRQLTAPEPGDVLGASLGSASFRSGATGKKILLYGKKRHRSQWKPSCGISQNMLEMVRFGDIQDAR
jgi:hypothetical protein